MDQKLIPALIDFSIEYHTRKGMRDWCDCDYCVTKRNGTSAIAHIGTQVHYSTPHPQPPWRKDPWDDDYFGIKSIITTQREMRKEKLTKELEKLKKEL